ncbi:hypothetical protein N8T08_010500 [Aspergillus melleus]|uniref:Uncharacterized protein n=1 Tax=Aspergillus melleus TaxID=138277 RepID=A0ACC3ARE5_9EURO|nr:hypothetical protein N8T08_010500 [Aspergillus melleus]
MPVAQYDSIGDRYTEVANLPTGLLQQASMQALVGDIMDLTVLDLACGAGSYTQKTVTEWGARHAVGVDISPLIIEVARRRTQDDPRVEFHVADCGQSLYMGQFDIVICRWLLNYATNDAEMLDMWRNIFNNLKPGGRVIGLTPDLGAIEKARSLPVGNYYGQSVEVLEWLENGGVKVQTTMHTSEPFSFQSWFLPREMYNKGAKLAGMKEVQWVTNPDFAVPGVDMEQVRKCPLFNNFTAIRPLG